MSPQTLHRFEAALGSPSPVDTLRREVADRIVATSAQDAYRELREFLYLMRERGYEGGEDLALDVMDSLSGWGNPDFALVPSDQAVSA